YVENSTIAPPTTGTTTNSGDSVVAQEKATITALAIAGDGGGTFALGGAVVVNVIDNATDAHISKDSHVTAANDNVLVSSKDTSTINVGAGQVSIATGGDSGGTTSGAGGAAVLVDDIHNITRAYIDSSTVTSTHGNVQVLANSDLSITSVAAGVD